MKTRSARTDHISVSSIFCRNARTFVYCKRQSSSPASENFKFDASWTAIIMNSSSPRTFRYSKL
jgi:hypothetical protein